MINKKTGNTPKVPPSRFNIDAHFHKNNDRPGSFGVLGGYFLDGDLNEFDPNLFNITPIEAMWMDPQQRKLLEVVYEALESGGIKLEDISGSRTAVFAASFTADWQQMSFKESSFRHSLAATGVDPGIISNRISHVFNLKGPSIVCNTACSSSVYALHNACNSLRNCEAEAAIVGGGEWCPCASLGRIILLTAFHSQPYYHCRPAHEHGKAWRVVSNINLPYF